MADCFYHGQSLPGPCPDCDRAQQLKLAPQCVESTITPIPMEERYDALGRLFLEQLRTGGKSAV
jgi:hypothetical protein